MVKLEIGSYRRLESVGSVSKLEEPIDVKAKRVMMRTKLNWGMGLSGRYVLTTS